MSQATRKTLCLEFVAVAIIALLAVQLTASCVFAADELAQGPLLAERSKLQARIEKLKADGVGIKPYQDALSSIEESVAAKEPDDQIQKSVARLNSALDQQMQSKAAISSNSYYHVHGSPTSGHSGSTPPGASTGALSGLGGLGSGSGGIPTMPKGMTPEMLQKIIDAHPEMKQKYEDYKKTGHL